VGPCTSLSLSLFNGGITFRNLNNRSKLAPVTEETWNIGTILENNKTHFHFQND
jgi:hypothetical protein